MVLIEVCVDSVESAIAAVQGGADRLELCANLGAGGGTTPSLGLFKAIQLELLRPGTQIMVMIRPRVGDFLYSELELQTMREDIRVFKEHGAAGVVLGVLTKDGRVDTIRTRLLADEAYPMQVCFHRAFDMTRDATEALETVQSIPHITRILTSGHTPKVTSSLLALQSLLQRASSPAPGNNKISILPGSGINPETVELVLEALLSYGLHEIHLSAGSWVDGGMEHRPSGMGMGIGGDGEWGVWKTSEETVRKVRLLVDSSSRALALRSK